MNQTDRVRISRLVADIDAVLEGDPRADVVASRDLIWSIKEDLKSLYHNGNPSSVVYLRNLVRSRLKAS